jgi:hypothetical protein
MCCASLGANTEAEPYLQFLESVLQVLWLSCRKGIAFNILSPLVDCTHPAHARPQMGDVVNIVTKLTKRFTLLRDYMPFEYAIHAFKDDEIDHDLLIFSAQKHLFAKVTGRWQPPG